ncbi:MAG: trans-sulfuration enzyme family protein, partial [Actinomycetota bacterium]
FHAGGDVVYGRAGNPTWDAFEAAVGALEGGRALAFSSGMAAISAVLERLPVGSVVVLPNDAYYGTRRFAAEASTDGRLSAREVDVTDTDATLAACDGASLLWLESPTNPLLAIADLPALCAGARALGVPVCVDNTFATPLLQRPLDLGAEVVVHSATKYISGHADVLMGVVVTRDEAMLQEVRALRELYGGIPGPMETYLALRGLRTLGLRLERAQSNAGTIAQRLAQHEKVRRVLYPGLASDPGHERARAQMSGFGAMIAFEVADADTADRLTASLEVITDATSLGGIETTLDRRSKYPGETGVAAGLLRMNVGCEHLKDLWSDLQQALDAL